jgi:hypothetical protein
MTTRPFLRCSLAFLAALMLPVSAEAQLLFRAYLAPSPAGNDANPCTLPAPCRLLPAALAAVADGGEIWMLDSANFNTASVAIGKSVSILAVPGAVGSVLAIGGPAISITADNLKVALRNLVIVPLAGGGGTNGIEMTGASTLTVEDSLIANLPVGGVRVQGAGIARVTNTILRNNGASAVAALNGPNVSISATKMLGNSGGGVLAYSDTNAITTKVSISDSIISGGSEGVYAYTLQNNAATKVIVTRSTIENVGTALLSENPTLGSAVISVSNSMLTNNSLDYNLIGAFTQIKSFGNNHMEEGGSGTLTVATLK